MAWISVHEQILGGKLRELSKEIGCSQNEALGILVRFWLWGINNASKDGMIVGAEKEDVAEALSVGKSKEFEAGDIIEAMIATGWLDENGTNLFIHDWEVWQAQWYKFVGNREKNNERQKRYREKHQSSISEKIEAPAKAPKIAEAKEPEPVKKPSAYTTEFEEFWKVYPRKVGKGEAYKKYKARVNDGYSEAELLQAATNYASRCRTERTEEKYIKHAKTFLSESLPFTDYIKKEQQKQEESYQEGANPFERFRQEV